MILESRLRRALDHDPARIALLAGDMRDSPAGEANATAAAVLVPITDRAEPGLILTQRTDTLRRHAGQVAFPGGRIDPGDADAAAAALREAHEEIALPPAAVRVIGSGDIYRTGTGFAVTPVIGIIPADLALVPSEAEVAAVFEVPLAYVLDPANQREASVEWQGKLRHFYEIHWGERRIWGATAGMIVNLSRRLTWEG